MKKILVLLLATIAFQNLVAQDYSNWSSYQIEEFYAKKELPDNTLNESGQEIRFVFVPTTLDKGTYAIQITDADGDFYKIKDTEIYLKFRLYFGYAGYGQEGIIEVGYSSYNTKFYKKP